MLLFCHNYIKEFDKNANSINIIVVTLNSYKVSLATIGVCVFVRLLRWAHFFICTKETKKEKNNEISKNH